MTSSPLVSGSAARPENAPHATNPQAAATVQHVIRLVEIRFTVLLHPVPLFLYHEANAPRPPCLLDAVVPETSQRDNDSAQVPGRRHSTMPSTHPQDRCYRQKTALLQFRTSAPRARAPPCARANPMAVETEIKLRLLHGPERARAL